MAEEEMNKTKAWAIISSVVVVVGLVLAGAMFFLGLTVGQHGNAEATENCTCENKNS